jgi:hypothetical protein
MFDGLNRPRLLPNYFAGGEVIQVYFQKKATVDCWLNISLIRQVESEQKRLKSAHFTGTFFIRDTILTHFDFTILIVKD